MRTKHSRLFSTVDSFVAILVLTAIAGAITIISKKHLANEYVIYSISIVGLYAISAFIGFIISLPIFCNLNLTEATTTKFSIITIFIIFPVLSLGYLIPYKLTPNFDSKLTWFSFHAGAFILTILAIAIPVNIFENRSSKQSA